MRNNPTSARFWRPIGIPQPEHFGDEPAGRGGLRRTHETPAPRRLRWRPKEATKGGGKSAAKDTERGQSDRRKTDGVQPSVSVNEEQIADNIGHIWKSPSPARPGALCLDLQKAAVGAKEREAHRIGDSSQQEQHGVVRVSGSTPDRSQQERAQDDERGDGKPHQPRHAQTRAERLPCACFVTWRRSLGRQWDPRPAPRPDRPKRGH